MLLRDLSELVKRSDATRVSLFAKTLKDHFVYPVDIQVLSPKAELIVHQPDNKLRGDRVKKYLMLLAAAAKGEVVNNATSEKAGNTVNPASN